MRAGSSEEVKQREGEGRREQPGCSMRVDLLAVMLSNSPQHRTAGGEKEQKDTEDDEGEGIVFSHQKEAGGGNSICTCQWFYLCYKVQKG